MTVRLSKILLLGAIALWITLVAVGNLTDYGSNLPFVQHVLLMDTIFPDAAIHHRAIHSPWLHHVAYGLIIAVQALAALLCWWGVTRLVRHRRAPAVVFNREKRWGVAGLTLGFLLWQLGFIAIGGEWFGMWMSSDWNGVPSAFRFAALIGVVLIYLVQKDDELL